MDKDKRIKQLEVGLEKACGEIDRLRSIKVNTNELRKLLRPQPDDSLCNFNEAWRGNCKERSPCKIHKGTCCWKCGEQATRSCDHTGAFVCGVPCCPKHRHVHEMRRAW